MLMELGLIGGISTQKKNNSHSIQQVKVYTQELTTFLLTTQTDTDLKIVG